MVRFNYKPDYIIGIDPDNTKSGLCLLTLETKAVQLATLDFPELIDYIHEVKQRADAEGKTLIVSVEAGWLVHSNWHLSRFDSRQLCAAKGRSVGMNHQTGILICRQLIHDGIIIRERIPLKKVWRDGKISHDELAQFVNLPRKRTNQEERDATLLAWDEANFPIRVTIRKIKK